MGKGKVMRTLSSEQGFTLTEIFLIIVIIGVFAVVAVPRAMDLNDSAVAAQCKQNQSAILTACTLYVAAGEGGSVGVLPNAIGNLVPKYIKKEPECKTNGKYGYLAGEVTCGAHPR